jgi:hypothetical protein
MAGEKWIEDADLAIIGGRGAGFTVEQADRQEALGIIESHTGAIENDPYSTLSARDRLWLGRMVAYQWTWMLDQPDFHERKDTTSEDGATGTPSWLTLAPMARVTMKRLSWKGTRTVRLPRVRRVALLENGDPLTGWEPM